MRILYVTLDQTVPGSLGGSVHVQAVAEGLAARGHTVHVLATRGAGGFPDDGVEWRVVRAPMGIRQLRWAAARHVESLARRFRPDAIIERYYNFGGEGIVTAKRTGAAAVLEVNAPIIDHPGSLKHVIDRAVLIEPMRRWRDWQCRVADLIVTPSAAIVPQFVPRSRLVLLEWGADTGRFRPGAPGTPPFSRRPGRTLAIFTGAFRRWHGAIHLVEALKQLRGRGDSTLDAVLVGHGPEWNRTCEAARGLDGVTFTGALPHDDVPPCLSHADIGVAPFDVGAHAPLALDFYWSPLKIFEYMATGLPVVTPNIPRLAGLVRHEREGLLYDAEQPDALASALSRLTDPNMRARLGGAARERAETEFSWASHCARLEAAIVEAIGRRRSGLAACES